MSILSVFGARLPGRGPQPRPRPSHDVIPPKYCPQRHRVCTACSCCMCCDGCGCYGCSNHACRCPDVVYTPEPEET